MVDLFLESQVKAPTQIILDLDATDDPLHGQQEGRFFHGYYDCYCYLPLYVFCGRHLLAAKLRRSNIDASAGAVGGSGTDRRPHPPSLAADTHPAAWRFRLCPRGIDGVVRGEPCDYVLGLARNARLEAMVKPELIAASLDAIRSGRPARRFKDFRYMTQDSWSRERSVIGKAEVTSDKANPRFIVTSLKPAEVDGRRLYEKVYCARSEMENRIKECQLDLFADRTSAAT